MAILQCGCRSGSKNAKVILVETVIAPGDEPHMAKWLDMVTKSPVSVIEAQKL